MKNQIILILAFISCLAFGQPNPQERYPERIKAITELLKTDPLNYELIWERLEMKVNLMGGFGTHDELFSSGHDSVNKIKTRALYFEEFNAEFNTVYNHVIKVKKFDIVEEGDFYLNRIWFYFNMNEIDKAIEDAKYLRDSASYSRFWQTGSYYNDWALYSLFRLYVIKKQYAAALTAIDTLLEKKKKENPAVYFSGHGSFLSYSDKISLLEHASEKDKMISSLKENCSDHFNWYFENAKPKDYYTDAAKEQSFEALKLVMRYMKKYADKELPGYEKVYKQLRYQANGNHETINPDIGNDELKSIVSQIR